MFSIFDVAEVFVVFHTCTGSKDGQNGRIIQENRNLETFVKPQNTNYLRYTIPRLDAFPAVLWSLGCKSARREPGTEHSKL